MFNKQNPSPSLDNIINDLIERKLYELNTSMPGIIVSFNATQKTCSVMPALKRKYEDGIKDLPIIQNVPICYPQTNNALISFPLEVGDNVLLVISQRSLDNWKEQAGNNTVDPEDIRRNSLTDAVCIPGILKKGDGIAAENDKMIIRYHDMQIKLHDTDKIEIKNSAEELLQIIDDTLAQLEIATTNTIFGPMKLNNFAAFTAIKTRLSSLKV